MFLIIRHNRFIFLRNGLFLKEIVSESTGCKHESPTKEKVTKAFMLMKIGNLLK